MNSIFQSVRPVAVFIFTIVLWLGVRSSSAAENLSDVIGESREKGDEITSSYSVSASGPLEANQQEVQLLVEQTVSGKKRATQSQSQKITLKTGKTKTVAQVIKLLEDVFQRFHAGKTTVDGRVLGTLGNLKAGGILEMRASRDKLLFVFQYADGAGATSQLTRNEVAGLLLALQNR